MAGVTTDSTPKAPIRVGIVDDDPLVRAGLSMILGGSSDVSVVGEAGDGLEAETMVAAHFPDVVLMDIRMPRRDGIAATRVLLSQPRAPKIIVLTTFDTNEIVLSALRSGAAGFLLKDTPPAQIVEAVCRVFAGEPMLSPTVTAQLIAEVASDTDTSRATEAQRLLATLTERERQVAVAVGQGKSNADIAGELYLSVATVKAHVSRLFAKLNAGNRVQIAMCVHDAGLV